MKGTQAIVPPTFITRLRRHIKPLVFATILVLAFFSGLELLLTLFGVRPLLTSEDPLLGFAGNIPLFVEVPQADGQVMLRTADNKLPLFNAQSFPKRKANDTYRIFCMGASTTYGHPYTDKTSFCGWLREFLKAVAPERHWEVINAGGVSYASYRVAKLMDELSHYQPDLFIVYSGQNEFLEKRSYGRLSEMPGWLLDLNAAASGTRTYTALKNLIDRLQPDSFKKAQDRYKLSGEVDDILSHTIGPTTYHRADKLKQQIISHYRLNLNRMTKIARQANAEIIYITPASNLKDMSPFKSEHRRDLTEEQLREWQSLFQQGAARQAAGDSSSALASYRRALAIDERHAELHYRIGQTLYDLQRFAEAEAEFWRAVDEDIAPLRILRPMTNIVAEVAAANTAPLIDFPALLRATYLRHYPHAVFGNEYFIDHVHPTIEGYRLLGLALLEQLAKQGVIPSVDIERDERITAVSQRVVAQLNTDDHAGALRHLGKLFNWAGKHEEARHAFLESLKLKDDPLTWSLLGKNALRRGKPEETIEYLRQAVRIDPNRPYEQQGLAYLLARHGQKPQAITHYLVSLRVEPDDADTHHEVALLLAEQGDNPAALLHFNEALRPQFEKARYNLVMFLIRQHEYAAALRHSRELLRLNPKSYLAHDSIGVILASQGDFEGAMAAFGEALRIKPGYARAKHNLQETLRLRDQARASKP